MAEPPPAGGYTGLVMTAADAGRALRKRIEAKVRRYILDRGLLPADGSLLLAVSGGPDSTALLLVLSRLAKALGLRLAVAHFDHGLRGAAAAAAERDFVRRLCDARGLAFFAGSGDARGRARRERLSVEDAARRERYGFLARAAAEAGVRAVATGHTAGDQAETVLLNLVRGAGLPGLAAMRPRAPWPVPGHGSLTVVRPLLCLTREETLSYCLSQGIEPLEDESNLQPEFRRNRVRHEVLPLLRQLNPAVDDALLRVSEAAAEDVAYIESIAAQALQQAPAGARALSRRLLGSWPASPRRHALRLGLEAVAGDLQGFSGRHLRAIERLVLEGKTGDRLDLPRGLEAVLRRDVLQLRRAAPPVTLPDGEAPLTVPGEARFGCLRAGASLEAPARGAWADVDRESVARGLFVRRRRPGDRFWPAGGPEKKLQDFLVDAHVPRDERDAVPLFVTPRGIVWVGGHRVAEWARPRAGKDVAFLWFREADDGLPEAAAN